MQQASSMTILRNAGLVTPTSRRVATAALSNLVFAAEQIYYCRATVNGHKTTVSAVGALLAEELASLAGPDDEWLIQPLLDFPFGGAAFVDDSCVYVEVAAGATVGLLRNGELSFASFEGGTVWSRRSAQVHQWRYHEADLVTQDMGGAQPLPSIELACEVVAGELRRTKIRGLVEWARLEATTYYLDLKPAESLGVLPRYVKDHLEPSEPEVPDTFVLEVPALEDTLQVPEDTPLTFRRGARLSHAVTYRCARGQLNSYFMAW